MRHRPNQRDQQPSSQFSTPKPVYRHVFKVYGSAEGHNCTDCGWPLKATSSAMFAGKTEEGERQFRHARCPSLSERRALRAEAMANA